MARYYHDYNIPEVEKLARAVATARGVNPDGMISETGHPQADKVPCWWLHQEEAMHFIAMRDAPVVSPPQEKI